MGIRKIGKVDWIFRRTTNPAESVYEMSGNYPQAELEQANNEDPTKEPADQEIKKMRKKW